MTLRLAAPIALLLASALSACGDQTPEASPAPAPTAAAAENPGVAPDLKSALEAIATESTPLHSEKGRSNARIAANGELTVRGAAVAIDDAQRAALLAYRAQLIELVQAGKELSARSTDAVGDRIGDAIGNVFEGRAPGEASDDFKAKRATMDALAQRICDGLPALLAAQDAAAAAVPEFKPYAHFVEADAAACRGSKVDSERAAEKIGHAIGAALGNPFQGGLVAGYMAAKAEAGGAGDAPSAAPAPAGATR